MVQIGDGDYHRTTLIIQNGELLADCDCHAWNFDGWCAHVAHLWWEWSRGRAVVTDLDTDRSHSVPPVWLSVREDRDG